MADNDSDIVPLTTDEVINITDVQHGITPHYPSTSSAMPNVEEVLEITETPEEFNEKFFPVVQWSYLGPWQKHRACVKMNLNEVYTQEVLHSIMGWSFDEVKWRREKDPLFPLQDFFNILSTRIGPECPIFCTSPKEHFEAGICAAIEAVCDKIHESYPDVLRSNILCLASKRQVFLGVDRAKRRQKQGLPLQVEEDAGADSPEANLPIYSLPAMGSFLDRIFKKKRPSTSEINVLLIDCFLLESQNTQQTWLMLNMIENFEFNVELFIAPELGDNGFEVWEPFIDNQFQFNADCVVVVATTSFLSLYSAVDRPNALPDRVNGPWLLGGTKEEIHMESRRVRYLWSKMKASIRPIFVVVFDRDLIDRASKISPMVFQLPDQIRFLLYSIKDVVGED